MPHATPDPAPGLVGVPRHYVPVMGAPQATLWPNPLSWSDSPVWFVEPGQTPTIEIRWANVFGKTPVIYGIVGFSEDASPNPDPEHFPPGWKECYAPRQQCVNGWCGWGGTHCVAADPGPSYHLDAVTNEHVVHWCFWNQHAVVNRHAYCQVIYEFQGETGGVDVTRPFEAGPPIDDERAR